MISAAVTGAPLSAQPVVATENGSGADGAASRSVPCAFQTGSPSEPSSGTRSLGDGRPGGFFVAPTAVQAASAASHDMRASTSAERSGSITVLEPPGPARRHRSAPPAGLYVLSLCRSVG